MTTLARTVMVRSRVIEHEVYGRLQVIVHALPDGIYEVGYLRTETDELLCPEVRSSLQQACGLFGQRFAGLIDYARALHKQRREEGETA